MVLAPAGLAQSAGADPGAALQARHPGCGIEVSGLVLQAALAFGDGPRRVVCRLRPEPGEAVGRGEPAYDFTVESRTGPDDPWTCHARARVRPWVDDDEPVRPLPEASLPVVRPGARAPQAGHPLIAFGPRWDNLQAVARMPDAVAGRLVLASRFEADLRALTTDRKSVV